MRKEITSKTPVAFQQKKNSLTNFIHEKNKKGKNICRFHHKRKERKFLNVAHFSDI